MDINEFVKTLRPTQNEIEVLQNTINSITRILQNDNNLSIAKTYPAGSFAKGTMLRGNCEADIIYIVNKNYDYEELLNYVFKIINGNFPNAIRITNPHKSIKLEIKKNFGILDFDILPAFEINSPKQLSEVKNPKYYAGSATKFHIEYIKQQKEIDNSFGDIVRILKYWKKLYNVPLTGFQIELLIAYGINGKYIKNWGECLTACFKAMQTMANGKVINPINWQYFNNTNFIKDNKHNAWIIDPGNSKNNVAGSLSVKQIKEIASEAHQAINAIQKNELENYLKME